MMYVARLKSVGMLAPTWDETAEPSAGPNTWSALDMAATIRHVLTHNAGVIDAKFLNRMPQWHQAEGQKLVIVRDETLAYLDALNAFADAVIV